VASTSKSKGSDQELVEMQRAMLSGPTVGVPYADEATKQSYAERRAAQREAYGQFRAVENIHDPEGNSLVFTAGMQVPVEHVEKWLLEETGKVERVASAEDARKHFLPPGVGPGQLIPESGAAVSSPSTSTDKK
jgi:hypothetical protein